MCSSRQWKVRSVRLASTPEQRALRTKTAHEVISCQTQSSQGHPDCSLHSTKSLNASGLTVTPTPFGVGGGDSEDLAINMTMGLGATIAACCCSGLAGVYFEMILKVSVPRTAHTHGGTRRRGYSVVRCVRWIRGLTVVCVDTSAHRPHLVT